MQYSDQQKKKKRKRKIQQQYQKQAAKANQLVIQGNFQKAFQAIQQLIMQYPKQPQSYNKLSLIFQQKEDYQKAAIYYQQYATVIKPVQASKWCKSALFYKKAGRFRREAYCLSRALKCQPFNIHLLQMQADVYHRMNRQRKAILYYKKAFNLGGSNSKQIGIKCSKIYYYLKQYTHALQILLSLQISPDTANMISQCYQKLQQFQNGANFLQQNIQLCQHYKLQIKRLLFKTQIGTTKQKEIIQLLKRYQTSLYKDTQKLANCCYQKDKLLFAQFLFKRLSEDKNIIIQQRQEYCLSVGTIIQKLRGKKQGLKVLHELRKNLNNSSRISSQCKILQLQLKQQDQQDRIFLSDEEEGDSIIQKNHINILPKIKKIKISNTSQITRIHNILNASPQSAPSLFLKILQISQGPQKSPINSIQLVQTWINLMPQKSTQLQRVALTLIKNKHFKIYKKQKVEIARKGLISSLHNCNYKNAFHLAKPVLYNNSQDSNIIQIMSFILYKLINHGQYRTFISKLTSRVQQYPQLARLIVMGYLETGYFQLAIKYLQIILKNNSSSLLFLTLATSYAQLLTSRTSLNKVFLATQASKWFNKYLSHSQIGPEQIYNAGRFYAQIGFGPQSLKCFQKVLQQYPENQIAQKAKFNLCVIHRDMGNYQLCQIYKR